MAKKKVICGTHGEADKAYVCAHLVEEDAGLGFNRRNPTKRNPYPDAWCDNCEIIRTAHNGWTEESEKLAGIRLVCSECYGRIRILNTRPTVTLDDLAMLRWKCGDCEEWHTGACLDFSHGAPHYWRASYDTGSRWNVSPTGDLDTSASRFLDDDYCAIDGDYFVRGLIHLPIVGADETFRWGVWGSLSRANFETLLRADGQHARPEVAEMFSWLSTSLPEYPDTLNLKMWAMIQASGQRPHFRLERADHPLAKEFHEGIAPERVREIMLRRLPAQSA
jgi:hypothetical protein